MKKTFLHKLSKKNPTNQSVLIEDDELGEENEGKVIGGKAHKPGLGIKQKSIKINSKLIYLNYRN